MEDIDVFLKGFSGEIVAIVDNLLNLFIDILCRLFTVVLVSGEFTP